MTRLDRRLFSVGAALAALGAPTLAHATLPDSVTVGAANAPLHLEEYASATCGHCAHFHETNWAQLKSAWIDTGRVRLTVHEILTPPPSVALAMFQIARCEAANGEEYMRRLGVFFSRQRAILSTGTSDGVRAALVATGAEFGLNETQIMACANDEAGVQRVMRSIDAGSARGVSSTPTFFLNGQRQERDFQTPEGMARVLEAAAR